MMVLVYDVGTNAVPIGPDLRNVSPNGGFSAVVTTEATSLAGREFHDPGQEMHETAKEAKRHRRERRST
ncbi:MAG: hypothetical protein IPP33_13190 [Flavobacteriales bacterium]|nr:hypothetical protein [Flavobacteriales bacterium]